MFPWEVFVIGLIVGWLIELAIDVFYWRKRRLCPDDNVIHIQGELDKALAANGRLQADLNGRDAKIVELEGKLNKWRGELDGLNEGSKGWGFGSIFPNGDLSLGAFLSGIRDRFTQFQADLDGKDAEIGELNVNLNSKDVQLGDLQANLDAKDVELGNVRAELDGLDKEANRLGLGSLFAGGGLAIGGFLSNLRNRFDKDEEVEASANAEFEGTIVALRGDLETKDARIGELEAELEGCNVKMGKLEAELGELDAEMEGLGLGKVSAAGGGLALGGFLENLRNRFKGDADAKVDVEGQLVALRGDLETKDARIGELEAELEGCSIKMGKLEAELGELDAEMEGLGLGKVTAAGGGGLALGGFLANLRNRFDGGDANAELEGQIVSLQGDLETKDARIGELEAELEGCSVKMGKLEAELGELDAEMEGLGLGKVTAAGGGLALGGFLTNLRSRFDGDADANGRISDLEAQLDICQSSLAEMRARDVEYMGPRGLSMVWGLNSDASDKLEDQGIYTYSQLGATAAADVDDALSLSQKYYPDMSNPEIHGSWVEQSRFAAGGDWDGLFAYQQSNFAVASLKDDLKKMWGIGPKVEEVLNSKGIFLWSQLASVPAERITDILRDAGSRFSMSTGKLHESWPKQARLADQGKWDEFEELTDKLSWTNVN